jgi:hypothetical protein
MYQEGPPLLAALQNYATGHDLVGKRRISSCNFSQGFHLLKPSNNLGPTRNALGRHAFSVSCSETSVLIYRILKLANGCASDEPNQLTKDMHPTRRSPHRPTNASRRVA